MKLFKHQLMGLSEAEKGSRAFYWDCGTGKTALMLTLINIYKYNHDVTPALVVCPLSIIDAAWIEDCKKFTPQLDIVSLWSKKPKERLEKLTESHDIYVCNYETYKSLWKHIQAKGFQVLVVDESSKMKCPTSQITRSLLAAAGIATRAKKGKKYSAYDIPYRYVLSGTPAPNNEAEYWAQTKMITGAGDEVFNDNFYAFRNRYFYSIPLGLTGQKIWKFNEDMRLEFNEKISEVASVVRKEDCLDLPDQVHEIREVTLSPPEQTHYDRMKKEYVLQFGDDTVLATSALVEVMKLRQLTSGFIYGDFGTAFMGDSKLTELKALLEEIGDHQVIVWANFKTEIKAITEALPNKSVGLWGGMKDDRDNVIKLFKAGMFQYLIANPQSAAHGLTFTNCNYAIYFSMNYSYEMQKQSEDRIHRIGQNNKCTYYYLLAKNTIDKVIYNTVRKKGKLSTETLEYLKG